MRQKNAVITGAGGLGVAIAKKFLQEGYQVFLLSKTKKELFADFAQQFKFLVCDLSDESQVASAFALIEAQAGPIDACVHTAVSPLVRKNILDVSKEEFKSQFQTDLFGGFSVFKCAAAIMKEQGSGSIIGVSSIYTEPGIAHPPLAGYVSSKFALRGLLRELAEELAPFSVRVNAVAPSFVATGLNKAVPERMVEFLKEKNPMRSLVTPEDVASVIFFLCSDAARTLTGLHIPVSFGECMNL